MNPTSLVYWYPVVAGLDGIKTPNTTTVVIGDPVSAEELAQTCLNLEPEHCAAHGGEHHDAVHEDGCSTKFDVITPLILQAALDIGVQGSRPMFVRTDLVSGKHGWRDTCHIPAGAEAEDVLRHVMAVLQEHEMALWMERDTPVRAIVLRELLTLEAPMRAFVGMPVARERRYFTLDGEVVCHHPYWGDEDNIALGLEYSEAVFDEKRWKAQLALLNAEPEDEVAILTQQARRVAQALPGHDWSVDFARTVDGEWYLLDMAEAAKSWHPEHNVAESWAR